VLRAAHAAYAEGLLARVEAQGADIMAARRMKKTKGWEETSQYAKDHPFDQVLSAFPEVRRFIATQRKRAQEGKTVGLLDSDRRHVLGQACAGLMTHMKSWIAAGSPTVSKDPSAFAKELSEVTPDAAAIVGFFSP
jgi:hypothetical protein